MLLDVGHVARASVVTRSSPAPTRTTTTDGRVRGCGCGRGCGRQADPSRESPCTWPHAKKMYGSAGVLMSSDQGATWKAKVSECAASAWVGGRGVVWCVRERASERVLDVHQVGEHQTRRRELVRSIGPHFRCVVAVGVGGVDRGGGGGGMCRARFARAGRG